MLPFPLWFAVLLAAIVIAIGVGFGAASAPALTVVLLAGSGIFAGALVMVAAAIVPTFRVLPSNAFIQLHQTLDPYVDRFMPKAALLTILVGITLTWLDRGVVRALLLVGTLLTVTVALISEFGNVPLNRIVKSWNHDTPPAGTGNLLERWCRFHLFRTIAGVLALGVFAVAAVLRNAGH